MALKQVSRIGPIQNTLMYVILITMKTTPTRIFRLLLIWAISTSLICPPLVWAQQTEVPLYIKYRYEKQYGRKWYDASPERQKEFMSKILKERKQEREEDSRQQALKELGEAQKKHAREMRKMRKELLEQARQRRKEERERQDQMRKVQLELKRAEISRRIQQRKAKSR